MRIKFSIQQDYIFVLLHCWVGKDWVGPFFPPPPSIMLGSFYLSSRLLDYVILLLYLNSLDLYQAENQVFKPTHLFVIVGWGKTGPAHSFPSPKSFECFVFRFMLLFHSILTFMKNLYQSENQVFNPTRLYIGTSTLLVGERLGRPILPPPPSIMLKSFNLLFSLSVYVTLWLYLNNFEWPIPKRDQVFKPTS